MIDTAVLAAELRSPRAAAIEGPIGLTPLADAALGLPVHRRHEADGDALTTAQVFLALRRSSTPSAPRRSARWRVAIAWNRPSGPGRCVVG